MGVRDFSLSISKCAVLSSCVDLMFKEITFSLLENAFESRSLLVLRWDQNIPWYDWGHRCDLLLVVIAIEKLLSPC